MVPILILIKATTPLLEHHVVVLVIFKLHASLMHTTLNPVAVKSSLEAGAAGSLLDPF